VPGRQRALDLLLPGSQPVHRRVQVIIIAAAQAQDLPQGAGSGLLAQPAGDRQLGIRLYHLRHRHGCDQVPVPGRLRVDQFLQPQLTQRSQHCGDVPVRQAAADLERALQPCGRQALQRPRQRLDLGLGPGRQVGQVRFLTLPPSR
jgi:hypothetical protein